MKKIIVCSEDIAHSLAFQKLLPEFIVEYSEMLPTCYEDYELLIIVDPLSPMNIKDKTVIYLTIFDEIISESNIINFSPPFNLLRIRDSILELMGLNPILTNIIPKTQSVHHILNLVLNELHTCAHINVQNLNIDTHRALITFNHTVILPNNLFFLHEHAKSIETHLINDSTLQTQIALDVACSN